MIHEHMDLTWYGSPTVNAYILQKKKLNQSPQNSVDLSEEHQSLVDDFSVVFS